MPTTRVTNGTRTTTPAFVASLAVGLASAGWDRELAVAELRAASSGREDLLAEASRLVARRCACDRVLVGTARDLLSRAAVPSLVTH